METKKVIEQSGIVNRNLTIKIDDDNKAILTQSSDFDHDEIVICEKHRTEVAKAIDQKYQELEDERNDLKMAYSSLSQHCDIITTELNWERDVVVKDLEQKLTSERFKNAKLLEALDKLLSKLNQIVEEEGMELTEDDKSVIKETNTVIQQSKSKEI